MTGQTSIVKGSPSFSQPVECVGALPVEPWRKLCTEHRIEPATIDYPSEGPNTCFWQEEFAESAKSSSTV